MTKKDIRGIITQIIGFVIIGLLFIGLFHLFNEELENQKKRGADIFGRAKGWYTISEREKIVASHLNNLYNIKIDDDDVFFERVNDHELNYYAVYAVDEDTWNCEHLDDNGNFIDRRIGETKSEALNSYAKVPN